MTERDLTKIVLDAARAFGWKSMHIRPARTKDGWRTPIQGSGVGWPDVVLFREEHMIAAELKVGQNRLTYEQELWLSAIQKVETVRAYTWREMDIDRIILTLKEAPCSQK